MIARIRKGDVVVVVRGKSASTRGQITWISSDRKKVIVEGANMVRRHRRASVTREKSGIDDQPAPIDASNVMHIDPQTGKPTRVAYRVIDGVKCRVSKKTGEKV